MTIKLFVQDQNDYGSSAAGRMIATFPTRAEALLAAQARLDTCLAEFYTADISAEDLVRQWSLFGEDVFFVPDDHKPPFSALAYVRTRSLELIAQRT